MIQNLKFVHNVGNVVDDQKKQKTTQQEVKEGEKVCDKCLKVKPNTSFQSNTSTKKNEGTWCVRCHYNDVKNVFPQKGSVVRFGKIGKGAKNAGGYAIAILDLLKRTTSGGLKYVVLVVTLTGHIMVVSMQYVRRKVCPTLSNLSRA